MFVECTKKTGLGGYGFSGQGEIRAWRSQETAPVQALRFRDQDLGACDMLSANQAPGTEILVSVEDGGRLFHTAPGHKKGHYGDPLLPRQIFGGIQWAMGEVK